MTDLSIGLGAGRRAFHISDPSGVSEVRRYAASLAGKLRFADAPGGQLAVAVTEAATNIVKHARHGQIFIQTIERAGIQGVEVLAVDNGPGIANIAESMRDGYSTSGSPGTGLGALKRMGTQFEIWSQPGKGTLVRFEAWPHPPAKEALPSGAINLPKNGEQVSGDAWTLVKGRGRVVVFVVDGLGHGPEAAKAARAAIEVVQRHAQLDAADLMDAVHGALRPTRGAAAAVAMLQAESELCSFCGVGNISASIRGPGNARSMVSHNGILGHQVRKIQEFSYPFPRGALCVVHSDGLATHWDLAHYPGLSTRHPALVAAALNRDHSRGRDDVTVVAVRNGGGPAA
jgi:anti-sigma regulatory factor (Ser/Thr protein kinase)